MLERAKQVIDEVSKQTDEIILFHSLSGKDSITLLDLCYPRFKRVVCVFMYIVKGLDHIEEYYRYAKMKYPNVEFIQVPHYALYSYIKFGFMGCKMNPKQRLWTLSDITEKIRKQTGIEWACYGFKQSDGLNRRVMLRTYTEKLGLGKYEAISFKSKKFYPLSTYKNADIKAYIAKEHLKAPEAYGGKGQSQGTDITDLNYHLYLKKKYPQDLERIYEVFPMTRVVLLDGEKFDQ